MRWRRRLGQAVAFDEAQPELLPELFRNRRGHRRAAAADVDETGEIKFRDVRAAEKVDHHRRDHRPACDLMSRDQGARELTIPARHDHRRTAQVDRQMQAVEHARDVKHRHNGKAYAFHGAVAPHRATHHVVANRSMRVDTAFR